VEAGRPVVKHAHLRKQVSKGSTAAGVAFLINEQMLKGEACIKFINKCLLV
jgi:hypothetical protein